MHNYFMGNINQPLYCKSRMMSIDDEAESLNMSTYFSIFQRVQLLACRRFKWGGLPEQVPPWWIETNLFYYDKIVYYRDKNIGDLILPAFNSDSANIYYIPKQYMIKGFGYNEIKNADEVEILWNNYLGVSTLTILDPLISNLVESYRARDVNVFNNKIPIIYKTSKSKEFTTKNIFNKVRKNVPVYFVDGNTPIDQLGIMNTNIPFIVDKMDMHIKDGWSDILTVLGIKSSNIEKGERVQTAEVEAGNEQVLFYRNAAIDSRKDFCDKVNKRYGTNLTVDWLVENEVIDNGDIYNDITGNAENRTVI